MLDLRVARAAARGRPAAGGAGVAALLVVDETRASGGVSEGVVTALAEAGYDAPVARVTSADSFVPLGPAADAVLLQEAEILAAAHRLLRR